MFWNSHGFPGMLCETLCIFHHSFNTFWTLWSKQMVMGVQGGQLCWSVCFQGATGEADGVHSESGRGTPGPAVHGAGCLHAAHGQAAGQGRPAGPPAQRLRQHRGPGAAHRPAHPGRGPGHASGLQASPGAVAAHLLLSQDAR